MIIPKLSTAIAYGGDYNPEQWPESVWHEDVRLMQEAGVNLVSVGIFSWAKLQPSERTHDFGWLDRIMDLLAAHGVFACLATASASPPPWLSKKYPDVLAVDALGLPFYPGARQHYSPFSPSYRRAMAALTRKLAERYRRHPALAAWHINNEYGCHIKECHGEASTRAFRIWLRRRYKTLETLNAAWGTAFWSQQYGAWDEIFTPRRAPTFTNPTQVLDFKRFMSEGIREIYLIEKKILNEATPEVPLTTNFMGFSASLDHWRWNDDVDFVAWDSYPDPGAPETEKRLAAAGHDLMRSLKKDRPFVLMEQAPSAVNWRRANGAKPPGLMRLWSLQAVARGADGVMFFQWRASRAGAEKFHSGMVQHVPPKHSRVFAEVTALGADLKRLSPVAGSVVKSRVAIAFDWEAWWAVELESKPGRIDYVRSAQEVHRFFYDRNIPVDFVHPGAPLGGYALVVAPSLYLLTKPSAENLTHFVRQGGVLVTTYFSGVVDENEHIEPGGYPAWLRDVLGMWVEEWAPYDEGRTNAVRFSASRRTLPCRHWCEVIHLAGATALGRFTGDFFAGRPAVTRHRFGQGAAYYVGTQFDERGLAVVLRHACAAASVHPLLETSPGVEVTLRENDRQPFLFVLNHGTAAVTVSLGDKQGRDLLTGATVKRSLRLSARAAAVIALSS